MSEVDERFKALNYQLLRNFKGDIQFRKQTDELKYNMDKTISFYIDDKIIIINNGLIDMKELCCIYEKCKELGWIE